MEFLQAALDSAAWLTGSRVSTGIPWASGAGNHFLNHHTSLCKEEMARHTRQCATDLRTAWSPARTPESHLSLCVGLRTKDLDRQHPERLLETASAASHLHTTSPRSIVHLLPQEQVPFQSGELRQLSNGRVVPACKVAMASRAQHDHGRSHRRTDMVQLYCLGKEMPRRSSMWHCLLRARPTSGERRRKIIRLHGRTAGYETFMASNRAPA